MHQKNLYGFSFRRIKALPAGRPEINRHSNLLIASQEVDSSKEASLMRSYHPQKTPASNALTDLIRAVLRMSAHAQKVGTILTKDLNLSNARWQTLGELNACQERLTVSQLARLMGLTRQSVQRLIDEMAEDNLVEFVDNPEDRRARHVMLTETGRATYQDALEREWQWTNAIADGFEQADLATAAALVEAVTRKMERDA